MPWFSVLLFAVVFPPPLSSRLSPRARAAQQLAFSLDAAFSAFSGAEGEGVPVEEWLTEPERDPCAAEGVDTGEKVAVLVPTVVSVLLTLGEGEEDTVADTEE